MFEYGWLVDSTSLGMIYIHVGVARTLQTNTWIFKTFWGFCVEVCLYFEYCVVLGLDTHNRVRLELIEL